MVLDRGLGDLIQKKVAEMMYVRTVNIEPGPWQIRETFSDQRDIEDSIEKHGILEPLLLKEAPNGKFHIIGGERRWRAAKKLNIQQVPARILKVSDNDALLLGIIENVQRSSLSPIEEAKGYQIMMKKGMTQEEVAKSIGKSRPYVANILRLLKLPESVQAMVKNQTLNTSQARALIGQKNPEAAAQKIIVEKQTVRDIEEEKMRQPSAQGELDMIADEVSKLIGMKVKILSRGRGGTVQIDYPNFERLDDFLAKLSS